MKINEANKLRLLYFLVICCTAAWLPLFANYCVDRGIDGIKKGILISIVPVTMFLVQPFYGILIDKFGYKKCLVLSSLLATISYICYMFGDGFVYLLIVTVFMAIFYNATLPILDSLSLKLVQSDPKFSYGTIRIAGALAWAMSTIVTGLLIDNIDTSVIFIVAAVSMFLVFVSSTLLKPDDRSSTSFEAVSFKNVGVVFNNKTLIFLLCCIFLISASTAPIWYFYSTYMEQNGASHTLTAYGLSLQGLCELPLFYFSARIIARMGLKTTLIITVFASAVRMLLYALISNPVAALSIELLQGFSWSLFWVVCVEYINKLVRTDWRATGQSLLSAVYYGIGYTVGNLSASYFSESKMRIAEIFLLNAGIVGVVGVVMLVWLRRG